MMFENLNSFVKLFNIINLFHVSWFASAVSSFVLEGLVTGTGITGFIGTTVLVSSVTVSVSVDWSSFADFVWSSVWSGLWFLGSFQGVWHDVFWETELFSEVGDTFVSQGPVVVLPGVVFLDESLGFEGLESFHDVKVSDLGVGVGGSSVFLGDHNTFLEEFSPDFQSIVGWDNHNWFCWYKLTSVSST